MSGNLRVLLVGGPMYDPCIRASRSSRSARLEGRDGSGPHAPRPQRADRGRVRIGAASYDLISTHTKYAPSQRQWLTPLDDDLDDGELEPFTPRTLELARIDGSLYSVPRNLDVKLLLYAPTTWKTSPPRGRICWRRPRAAEVRQPLRLPFPGKESDSSATSSSCTPWPEGRMFEDERSAGAAPGRRCRPLGARAARRISTRGQRPPRPRTGTTTKWRLLPRRQGRNEHRLARRFLHLPGSRPERRRRHIST